MLRHHALRIEDTAHQHMAGRNVPGVAIALVDDGEVVWSTDLGVASTRGRRHLCGRTIFEGASLGMPLFAYAVFRLIEQGGLDLDAPLAALLPAEHTPHDPRAQHVTARMCLSHTSGVWSASRTGTLRMCHEPGDRFAYSPGGYLYLQHAVEHLTGEPLQEWMRRSVLEPLGLLDTSYVWLDRHERHLAQGHDGRGCPLPKERPEHGSVPGTLHTTANDVARFMCAVMDPAHPLMSRCTADEMLRGHVEVDQPLDAGSGGPCDIDQPLDGGSPSPGTILWGLGWALSPTPLGMSFWHWGSQGGFRCFCLGWRQHRAGLVVVTNGVNGLSVCREVVTALIGDVHPAFGWLEH